jgi:hypothetical protein
MNGKLALAGVLAFDPEDQFRRWFAECLEAGATRWKRWNPAPGKPQPMAQNVPLLVRVETPFEITVTIAKFVVYADGSIEGWQFENPGIDAGKSEVTHFQPLPGMPGGPCQR